MSNPQITSEPKPPFPKQKLEKPGLEADMELRPRYPGAALQARRASSKARWR